MKLKINLSNVISTIFSILLVTVLISNIILGGDAGSGKIENDKYFVRDAIHKTNKVGEKLYVEVSKSGYYFNLSFTYLFLLTLPFFLFYRIKNILNIRKNKSSNLTKF
ncbi:MAG: hypothetical protein HXX18_08830 [Bacteroidetes bacterium]|nr:hypothetical protein [Bacteroidota bacterium]